MESCVKITDRTNDKINIRGSSMLSETMKERRGHERFVPAGEAFAVLRPDFKKLGKIRDVSAGGLSFEYIEIDDSQKESHLSQVFEMDLFSADASFFVKQIPCRLVYDMDITETEQQRLDLLRYKRCGLRFEELTNGHAEKIEFFLNNYVAQPHPPL